MRGRNARGVAWAWHEGTDGRRSGASCRPRPPSAARGPSAALVLGGSREVSPAGPGQRGCSNPVSRQGPGVGRAAQSGAVRSGGAGPRTEPRSAPTSLLWRQTRPRASPRGARSCASSGGAVGAPLAWQHAPPPRRRPGSASLGCAAESLLSWQQTPPAGELLAILRHQEAPPHLRCHDYRFHRPPRRR